MSLGGLLNQTINHYPKSSYGADGRAVDGIVVTMSARFIAKTKRILLPSGDTLTIDAYAIVDQDESINTNDRIDYDGQKYKVVDIYKAPDGNGDVHHQEVKLIKWQET